MKIPRPARVLQGSPAKLTADPSPSRGAKRTRDLELGLRTLQPRDSGFASRPGMTLAPRAGLLGRALRGLRKLRRDRRGLFAGSPARRLAAVTPRPRPVEGVDAELVH